MKQFILLLIAVFYFSISQAQYVALQAIPLDKFTNLDMAQLKFTYIFSYHRSYSKPNSVSLLAEDKQCLLIGKNISKYFSNYYFDYCKNIKAGEISIVGDDRACGFEIFKNYPANKITVTDQAGLYSLGGNYTYDEVSPNFQWRIETDTTTILTYSCQKATTTFRGRNYTAWFAPEIPSNNGPWKFGGLPGLILKIYDDKQDFKFECVGTEQLEKPEPINFYTLKYIVVKREQMDKIYRRFFNNPMQFWATVGSPLFKELEDIALPKLTYNPIELN